MVQQIIISRTNMETLGYIHSRILGIGPANNDQSLCYVGEDLLTRYTIPYRLDIAPYVIVLSLTVNND